MRTRAPRASIAHNSAALQKERLYFSLNFPLLNIGSLSVRERTRAHEHV